MNALIIVCEYYSMDWILLSLLHDRIYLGHDYFRKYLYKW